MKKEEAWEKYLSSVNSLLSSTTYPQDFDVQDAFDWGWEQAILSLEPAKDKIPYQEIISILNNITGRRFSVTDSNKRFIKARWHEGKRLEDFERVTRTKHAQWKDDPAMAVYLRPETLFGTKMDSYNNEPEPKRKKIIRDHMGNDIEVDE